MSIRFLTLLSAAALYAAPAIAASPPVEMLVSDAGQRTADGTVDVTLRLLNAGQEQRLVPLPDRVEGRIGIGADSRIVWLVRATDTPSTLTVPPGGFAGARYTFQKGDEPAEGALLSIPAFTRQRIAIAIRPEAPDVLAGTVPAAAEATAASTPANLPQAAPPPDDRAAGNAFLGNLAAYEPVYAVYGPGTNSEARIQLSFKYQLFGTRRQEGLPPSWRDGLFLAFTQRMFWDLGANSSPFRNIDYQPEVFYLAPSHTFENGVSIALQGGLRHESNGRDGDASRSVNTAYVAPMAGLPLGGGYRLTVAPRLSLYLTQDGNPGIRRYRGMTGLFAEVGEDDGLRLSTQTRFNFSSGKGAVSADISYPLQRLWSGGPDFYLFGQSFFGYGENLLDYNRRTTRLRIGLALVR